MKLFSVLVALFGFTTGFASPGDPVAGGNCNDKCDCWIGFEGEQQEFLSQNSVFICGVTENSPYRCSFNNELKWITQGRPFELELYKQMGETACYILKKK